MASCLDIQSDSNVSWLHLHYAMMSESQQLRSWTEITIPKPQTRCTCVSLPPDLRSSSSTMFNAQLRIQGNQTWDCDVATSKDSNSLLIIFQAKSAPWIVYFILLSHPILFLAAPNCREMDNRPLRPVSNQLKTGMKITKLTTVRFIHSYIFCYFSWCVFGIYKTKSYMENKNSIGHHNLSPNFQ